MGGRNSRVSPRPDVELELVKSSLRDGEMVLLKWCKELKLADGSFAKSFVSLASQGDEHK